MKLTHSIRYHLYNLSKHFSRFTIKLPTPQGWITTYTYLGGLSYAFNRPSESAILRHFKPKKGDIAVDIGANVGWYTLIAGHRVGKEGKVIAIEPEPRTFSILTRNIRDNGLSNVKACRVALSDRDGISTLARSMSPTGHRLYDKAAEERVQVKAMRLDTLLKMLDIPSINWMKMDVEGVEIPVLMGTGDYLSQHPKMVIETSQPRKLEFLLTQWNYHVNSIDAANVLCTSES